jgi:cell division septation protein DedD
MEQRESSGMQRRIHQSRAKWLSVPVIMALLIAGSGAAQTAREVRGAAAVEPLQNEPPAKIVIDPPLAEPLSQGRVVIQYRTENLHMAPVFGPAALAVSPRVGHIHVSVDDASWVWVNASGEPVILNGLLPGPHKILIQLENANHQLLDQGSIKFTVTAPPSTATASAPTASAFNGTAAVEPSQSEPPAKLIVDAPKAEPLSRGVLFLPYHAENLHILPVFGPAALTLSPRVGHIHVTVDDATWHWADASGVQVIINGLPAGPHKVLIQLVNANHKPIDQQVVTFTIPNGTSPHNLH